MKYPKLSIPKIESRALKYGYSYSRVSAMKGLLLSKAQLIELVKSQTPQTMMELLQKTSYKQDISEAAIVRSGFSILELACAKNFAKTAQKLIKIAPKNDKKLVEGLLIRWYLLNLKIIMQAKAGNETYEQIEPKLFVPDRETKLEIQKILNATDKDLARTIKASRFGKLLFSKWDLFTEAFSSVQKFFELESIFDSSIYSIADEILSGNPNAKKIREVLKKEVDSKNILLALRMKKMKLPKQKIKSNMLQGGFLTYKKLENIYDAKNLSDISPYLAEFGAVELTSENLVDLEISLEKFIAISKTNAFRRSILSVGSILGFLLIKEQEVTNLRKIIKAKEHKIPENEVQKMLVV